MTVQSYFDRIASDFDSYYGQPSGWFQAWTNRVLRKPGMLKRLRLAVAVLDRQPHQTILDLGCGSGVLSIPLSQQGHRLIGVDFSAAMIEIARQKALRAGVAVDFRVADICHADLPTVDACAALGVLEYATDPRVLLDRMLSLVRPGGVIVFDLPSLFNIHTPLRIPYLIWRRQRTYFHTRRSARRLFQPFADRIASAVPQAYGAGDLWVLERR